MTCPDPFDALQASQYQAETTWIAPCDWPKYLRSVAASYDSTSYLQKECMSQSGDDSTIRCPLLDGYCNTAESVFASASLLTVYSLYPNMALNVVNTSTSNDTINYAWRNHTRGRALELSSVVSTGLISYSALALKYSGSATCSTANLSNIDGQLSSRGVAGCWNQICKSYVASINPDFGGLGVRS